MTYSTVSIRDQSSMITDYYMANEMQAHIPTTNQSFASMGHEYNGYQRTALFDDTMTSSPGYGVLATTPATVPVNASMLPHPRIGGVINDEFYHLRQLTLVFYLSTFLVGMFGNGLVIYIIVRYSKIRRRSVANYYILNLALADSIYILTLPLFCYATYSKNWIFGNPTCKFSYVLREINKFGSVFTLAALSVDRYIASYHNLNYLRTVRIGKVICVLVWVAALVMCTPFLLYSHAIQTKESTWTCRINWPTTHALYHRRMWTYSQLAIGLLVPFFLICASYILLLRRLKAVMRPRGSSLRIRKPNRKMTRTVLVVFVIFIICQVPYYVMDVVSLKKLEMIQLHKYWPTVREQALFFYFSAISQILVFVSSCCNPVLYGILNENYRNLYRMTLCHFCLRGGNRDHPSIRLNGRRRSSYSFRNNNGDKRGSDDSSFHPGITQTEITMAGSRGGSPVEEDSPQMNEITLKPPQQINGFGMKKLENNQSQGTLPHWDSSTKAVNDYGVSATELNQRVADLAAQLEDRHCCDVTSTDCTVYTLNDGNNCNSTEKQLDEASLASPEANEAIGFSYSKCVCDINNTSLCECEALNSQCEEDNDEGDDDVLPGVISKINSYV